MRSLFASLKLDADSKKLHFAMELDRTIDDVRSCPWVAVEGHKSDMIATGRRQGPLFRVG